MIFYLLLWSNDCSLTSDWQSFSTHICATPRGDRGSCQSCRGGENAVRFRFVLVKMLLLYQKMSMDYLSAYFCYR